MKMVKQTTNEEIMKGHFHSSGVNSSFMCVSTERAMSRWLIDENEKGRLSGGSWSFSYQPDNTSVRRIGFHLT